MNRRDEFRLPPERDVSPELRARVLQQALSTDRRAGSTGRRALAPFAVGLVVAAAVLGVVVLVNHDDPREAVPPTGGGLETTRPAERHRVVQVDVRKLEPVALKNAMDVCHAAERVDRAGYVLLGRRLRTPTGSMPDVAYGNRESGMRYFCTPYGVSAANRLDHLTSSSEPVLRVDGSRVQGLLETNDGSGDTVYYEGTWFASVVGIEVVEGRIVVDGDEGVWHQTKHYGDYVFAPVWRTLTRAELNGDVMVQYRAISFDGLIVPIPGMGSTTVSPGESGLLKAVVDLPAS